MPTYEYECQKCGHQFELFQSITEKPRRTCPQCKGRVKRLLGTGAGLLFKGSGFYITDYRKPGYKEAAKKESSTTSTSTSSGSSSGSSSASSDAKKSSGSSKKE